MTQNYRLDDQEGVALRPSASKGHVHLERCLLCTKLEGFSLIISLHLIIEGLSFPELSKDSLWLSIMCYLMNYGFGAMFSHHNDSTC